MGWAHCGEDSLGRAIGYGITATCDHPGCNALIDRGLAYACGGMHGPQAVKTDDWCCEGYFCPDHLLTPAVERDVHPMCLACCQELERQEGEPSQDALEAEAEALR